MIDDFEDGAPLISLQGEPWGAFDDSTLLGSSTAVQSEVADGAGGTFRNIYVSGTLAANIDFGGFYIGFAGAAVGVTGISVLEYNNLRFYAKGTLPAAGVLQVAQVVIGFADGDNYNLDITADISSVWPGAVLSYDLATSSASPANLIHTDISLETGDIISVAIMGLIADIAPGASGPYEFSLDQLEFFKP